VQTAALLPPPAAEVIPAGQAVHAVAAAPE